MALNESQKNEIHRRANEGGKGNTGSALAKEFGVSASAISNIKNHYTPTEENTIKEVKEKAPARSASKKSKAKKVKSRTITIHSFKMSGHQHVSSASTFGELVKELKGVKEVEGTITGAVRTKLSKSTDTLPNGDFVLYLAPVKVSSGK